MLNESEIEGWEMDLISMSSLGHHETAVTISASAAAAGGENARVLRAPLVPHPTFNTAQSNKRRNVAESILLRRWRTGNETRKCPSPHSYPAFDQLSGPEVSGHLAKNRYVCFYSLLDGR